jgi:acetylornithine deacetylase/succinyl-diaminopimelate desuccinylase-like protein
MPPCDLAFDGEALVAEALTLARIPAPPFGEGPRGDTVAALIRAVPGWYVTRDGVGNVVARLGASTEGAIWLLVHLDTVFPAETPLTFTRADGVLRGPGIGDNAIALAAALALARQLPANLARPVALAFTVGEEGLGNLRGVRALEAAGEITRASAVLAVEGHRGDEIGNVAVGSVRYRATVRGPGGHSWWDRGTPSALHQLIAFCQGLLDEAATIPGELAVNIGTLTGGAGITAIAPEAAALLEVRSPENTALDQFERLAEHAAVEGPLSVRLELLGRRPGGVLPESHPLYRAAQAARVRAGLPPGDSGSSSSDANPLLARGVPALCLGITTGRNAHHLDEEIDIAPIVPGVRALAGLVLDLAGSGAPD